MAISYVVLKLSRIFERGGGRICPPAGRGLIYRSISRSFPVSVSSYTISIFVGMKFGANYCHILRYSAKEAFGFSNISRRYVENAIGRLTGKVGAYLVSRNSQPAVKKSQSMLKLKSKLMEL